MQIPFAVQSYLSRSRQVSRQRLVNGYMEKAPQGSKTQVPIHGCAGVKEWVTVGAGPLRGAEFYQGNLYVVSGETLYKVTESGAVRSVGALPGTDRVSIDAGDYLAIATHERVYFSDGASVTRVTDASFQGASDVAWLAGYYIYAKPRTGVFYVSSPGDPNTIDPLDYATAEAQPDDVVAVLTDSINVIFFGESSVEIWGLRGGAFPLIRHPNGVIDIGCIAPNSPAKLDNIAFWLADDRTVRMMSGQMQKISTEGIEAEFANYSRVDDAIGMTATIGGRASYILTFPTEGKTWEYSLNTGLWNELSSHQYGRWRGDWTVDAWGKTRVLDSQSNKVGYLDLNTNTDFGNEYVFKMVSAPVADGNRWLFHNGLYLDFETGGDSGEVMVRWSDDGFNWQPEIRRSLGAMGEYAERVAIMQNLGRAKNRVYEVSISDPVKRHFIGAEGEIGRGGY